MGKERRRRKRRECLHHRQDWYLRALDMVIDGKVEPDYATKRFQKLKEVRGK